MTTPAQGDAELEDRWVLAGQVLRRQDPAAYRAMLAAAEGAAAKACEDEAIDEIYRHA